MKDSGELIVYLNNINNLAKMSKIVVTGAAGFIGSCLIGKLNNKGYKDIVLVDDFTAGRRRIIISTKLSWKRSTGINFSCWFEEHAGEVEFVFHIGARTDTTEQDRSVFDKLNLNYSKAVWECLRPAWNTLDLCIIGSNIWDGGIRLFR